MTEEVKAPDKPITIDTIKTIFMRAIEDPQRGVPTLIGPPQWGKTHYIREWLMEHMESLLTGQYKKYRNKTMTIPRDRVKMKIAMVNPQSDMPEDIAGWPMRTKGELSFTNPSVTPASLFKKDAPPMGPIHRRTRQGQGRHSIRNADPIESGGAPPTGNLHPAQCTRDGRDE